MKNNVKQILKDIIFELTMRPPVHIGSLLEFCKFLQSGRNEPSS